MKRLFWLVLLAGCSKPLPEAEPLAFQSLGAPLEVLDVRSTAAREVYGCDLVLVRPDLHVAWRGEAPPRDPRALAAKVTGR